MEEGNIWFAIDAALFIFGGLAIIWCIVKFTGKLKKPLWSEQLIEKAHQAIIDLEDYYDGYPEAQREKNLKILKRIAIELTKLDREPNKKAEHENKEIRSGDQDA